MTHKKGSSYTRKSKVKGYKCDRIIKGKKVKVSVAAHERSTGIAHSKEEIAKVWKERTPESKKNDLARDAKRISPHRWVTSKGKDGDLEGIDTKKEKKKQQKKSTTKQISKEKTEIIDYFSDFYFLPTQKEKVTNFLEKLFSGEAKIEVIQVGFDFPKKVPSSEYDGLITVLNDSKLYDTIARDEKIGTDITQKTINALIKDFKIRQEREKKRLKIIKEKEGTIAFSQCWETGICRIVGKFDDKGHVERMPREEFFKVKNEFQKAWKKQFEKNNSVILSSAGTNWQNIFLKDSGFKSEIVETDDYYE